jgi:hypothetical protein
MAQNVQGNNPPTAFTICELPQRGGMAYTVNLLMSDGEERRIGICSHSRRGIRQQMSRHRAFKHLSERVMTPDAALFATVAAVARGERL